MHDQAARSLGFNVDQTLNAIANEIVISGRYHSENVFDINFELMRKGTCLQVGLTSFQKMINLVDGDYFASAADPCSHASRHKVISCAHCFTGWPLFSSRRLL